jgi:beta-lactamase superfamily II metal-dependent hydrolase
MSFDGFEIDMLSVGDADCILVTKWVGGTATRVLIDGGNAGNVDTVRQFLVGRGVKYIEHVVCTHPHDDHAAGLVELLKDPQFTFVQLWMHQPWKHIDASIYNRAWSQGKTGRVTRMLKKSAETQLSLARVAQARGMQMNTEPFAGEKIGPLFVCGPAKDFYEALLLEFADLGKLAAFESDLEQEEREDLIEDALQTAGKMEPESGLLDDPHTDPENNSATILWTQHGDETFVFTSDAGAQALERAKAAYTIRGCFWMQMPHHGSRHNITKALIQYFSPKEAFVSAAGTRKHPRRAVVNAFKEQGAVALSTHYPTPMHLWLSRGIVPPRTGYGPATAMYEATT